MRLTIEMRDMGCDIYLGKVRRFHRVRGKVGRLCCQSYICTYLSDLHIIPYDLRGEEHVMSKTRQIDR